MKSRMDPYKYHVTIYQDGGWQVLIQTRENQPVGCQLRKTGKAETPEQAEADARTYVQQQKLDRIRRKRERKARQPKQFTL